MNDTEDSGQTRVRVRALVRDVLENAVVIDDDQPAAASEIAANPTAPFSELANKDFTNQKNVGVTNFDRDESAKKLLTIDDLRGLAAGARLRVAENVKLTALAEDFISENRIELIVKSARETQSKIKTIAIGADHGGFEFKEKLKEFLSKQDFSVRDFGTNSTDAVDYPDFAIAVARAVAAGQAEIGIMIDGAGIGSAMAANKIAGVRAAACYNPVLAKNAREHNGANVLTLGSLQNTFAEICEIVIAFLASDLTEERHRKRVAKIEAAERQP